MKNAIILHGAGETPESFWIPYVRQKLTERERESTVWVPQLPDTDNPDLTKWLPPVLKDGIFTNETILLGHSSGCPLILSVLERINVSIRQALLVSGFSTPLPNGPKTILQDKYDWQKIKEYCQDFVFINSVNDPWGCNDKQGKIMFDNLGGTLVINQEGHMGSDTFHQPYKEFPLLIKLLKD